MLFLSQQRRAHKRQQQQRKNRSRLPVTDRKKQGSLGLRIEEARVRPRIPRVFPVLKCTSLCAKSCVRLPPQWSPVEASRYHVVPQKPNLVTFHCNEFSLSEKSCIAKLQSTLSTSQIMFKHCNLTFGWFVAVQFVEVSNEVPRTMNH